MMDEGLRCPVRRCKNDNLPGGGMLPLRKVRFLLQRHLSPGAGAGMSLSVLCSGHGS